VTAWAGLTVYRMHFCSSNKCIANIIIKYKSHKKDPLPQISTIFFSYIMMTRFIDGNLSRRKPQNIG